MEWNGMEWNGMEWNVCMFAIKNLQCIYIFFVYNPGFTTCRPKDYNGLSV